MTGLSRRISILGCTHIILSSLPLKHRASYRNATRDKDHLLANPYPDLLRYQQDGQFTYNVLLRHILVTTAAVEKQ